MYLLRPEHIFEFKNIYSNYCAIKQNNIIDWLNNYQGLPNWITAIVTLIALYFAIWEFFLKVRPYITTEIGINEQKDEDGNILAYHFFLILVNNGDYLGKAKINKAILKIGDEIYPTYFKTTLMIGKGESKKLSHLGFINQIGINKIRNKEYRNNKVTIDIEIFSKKMNTKKYKYTTKIKYEVNLLSNKPEIYLIKENIT